MLAPNRKENRPRILPSTRMKLPSHDTQSAVPSMPNAVGFI
jgi:hypothetical protein